MKTTGKKPAPAPEFRDLSALEVEAVLDQNAVGRIAFCFHDTADMRPIHYVRDGNWLFGRTSPGDKLITMRHNQWIAFETDEVEGPLDWRSVVVRGSIYRLEPGGPIHDVRLRKRALAAVRSADPTAFTDDDSVPFRTELFGISIDSASGRACSTAKGA